MTSAYNLGPGNLGPDLRPELVHVPAGGWTTDDLDEWPDDGIRRELIDGVLQVSPTPTHAHQSIAARLMMALDRTCPPAYEVTQAVELRITTRRSLIPDVLVVTAEAAARNPSAFAPGDVVLAVEIVSPSSEVTDRFTKPVLYATGQVPFYWVVDVTPTGVRVQTSRLDPAAGSYQPTGTHSERIFVEEPWKMDVPIDAMLPPSLRSTPDAR